MLDLAEYLKRHVLQNVIRCRCPGKVAQVLAEGTVNASQQLFKSRDVTALSARD
jgi:hypothetical protein